MSFVKLVICPYMLLGRLRNIKAFLYRGRKYFIIIVEWEIQGFVFHAVLFAVRVAREKCKLVSDVYDCKHFLNLFFKKYVRNLVKTINGIFSVRLFWSLDPEKKPGHFHTFRSYRKALIS